MNAFNGTPSPSPSGTDEEAIAVLRAELEAEASAAEARFGPLYEWLIELADRGSGSHIPERGPSARVLEQTLDIGRGVARHSVRIADDWVARMHAVMGEQAPTVFPDPVIARFEETGAPEGPVDDELVGHLEGEAAIAPAKERVFFEWLAKRARAGVAPPSVRGVVRMNLVAAAMGLYYARAQEGASIVRRWAEVFPGFGGRPAHPRRVKLPGCDAQGTGVPTDVLVAALRAVLDEDGDEDFARLHRHLLAVAGGERRLPRGSKGVNLLQTLRDAGIAEDDVRGRTNYELLRWVDFFHVEADLTYRRADGRRETRRSVEDQVADWLARLVDEDGQPLPILTNPKHPHGISWAWVSRETGIARGKVDKGPGRQFVEARWALLGPGPMWEGIPREERRMRAARRKVLHDFARETVERGDPLPAKDGKLRTLDHAALVKRSGRPGPNLEDDLTFQKMIGRLKPTYEYIRDDGGVPASYAQLIDGITRKRLRNNNTEGSRAVTRSKIDAAISIFQRHLGKSATSPIDDEFEQPGFGETLDEIVAAGKAGSNPDNWRSELNGAQKWLAERIAGDQLDDDFHDVLIRAVRKSGLEIPKIVEGIDLTQAQLEGWLAKVVGPTLDTLAALRPLALRLGLEEDRLHDIAGWGLRASKRDYEGYKPPKGAAEFMPDDWRSRHPDEQRAIGQWIDENLLHSNTIYGHTMREVARRVQEGKSAGGAAPAGDAVVDAALVDQALDDDLIDEEATDDGAEEAAASEPRERSDRLGRYFDRQLTAKRTGLPKRLVEELKVLRHHMTVDFPTEYLRRASQSWEPESTAPMKIAMLIRFFRWQIRPEDEDGLGRDPASLTMADLVHPPLVFAYIDHRARAYEDVEAKGEKRGKIFTSSEADLLRTVKSLVSREFGLVTQRTDLADRVVADERRLPEGAFISLRGHVYEDAENEAADEEEGDDAAPAADAPPVMPADRCGLDADDFAKACRRAENVYASAENHVDERAEIVRDPAEAIMPILDSPQPMATLLRQIALAGQKEPKLSHLKLQHHLHKRDMLIVRLLAMTTLRNRNLREITVGDRGKLSFDANKGMWRLRIHSHEFKNWKNAVLFGRRRRKQPYVKWLKDTRGLYALIEYYLEQSRPFLLKRGRQGARARGKAWTEPGELFLTSNGNPLDGQMMWKTVRRWTARHVAWNPFRETGVPLCQPFGPHAFRDIRATDILLHPETDNPFLEAAMALQTSPTMVQHHYGIVRTEKRTELDDISFLKRENLAWAGVGMD